MKKKRSNQIALRCKLTVRDLVDAGFLQVGDFVYFKNQKAIVNENSEIEFKRGGKIFTSTSLVTLQNPFHI